MSPAAASPSDANLGDLTVDFLLRSRWRAGHDLFHNLQQPQPLSLAQLSNSFVVIGDGLANNLALRLLRALGGMLQTTDRLVVQREGNLPYHTAAIRPDYYRNSVATS